MKDPLRQDCATAAAYLIHNLFLTSQGASDREVLAMIALVVEEAIGRYMMERHYAPVESAN